MGLDELTGWARRLTEKIYVEDAYDRVDKSNIADGCKRNLTSSIAGIVDDKMQVSPRSLYLVFQDHRKLYH